MASSPAEGTSPAGQKQFELLRQRFAAGLVARWLDISQAADAPARRTALHRLSGSAGSFGFEGMGQLAREAEMLCDSGDSVALAACLNQLKGEIKAAMNALGLPDGLV